MKTVRPKAYLLHLTKDLVCPTSVVSYKLDGLLNVDFLGHVKCFS